jgi:hypothetical protein
MFRQDLSQPPTEFWLGSSPETLPSPSVRSPLRRDRITEATLPGDEYETTEYGGLPEPFMRQPNGFGGLLGTPPGGSVAAAPVCYIGVNRRDACVFDSSHEPGRSELHSMRRVPAQPTVDALL